MAWHYGTYTCGCSGRINITGPTKDRDWKAEREFSKLCPDCWEKQKEKDNAVAAQKADEMNLPELSGSEKQVAWANTIRQQFIEWTKDMKSWDVDVVADRMKYEYLIRTHKTHDGDLSKELIGQLAEYAVQTIDNARVWIDNRGRYDLLIAGCYLDYLEAVEEPEAPEASDEKKKELEELEELARQQEAEAKAEATLYPQQRATNAVAEINQDDDLVTVKFERNEDFRLLVRGLGYSWNGGRGRWEKRLSFRTGSALERVAELGNALLNRGFPVRIWDEEARKMAVDGTFEPECFRWISLRVDGEYKGWLTICWDDGADLYHRARSLPGSKWSRPCVLVQVCHYKEVEDFARLNGFRLSPGAQEAIAEYKKQLEAATFVRPEKVEKPDHEDGLKAILESSDEVIDDLREED